MKLKIKSIYEIKYYLKGKYTVNLVRYLIHRDNKCNIRYIDAVNMLIIQIVGLLLFYDIKTDVDNTLRKLTEAVEALDDIENL